MNWQNTLDIVILALTQLFLLVGLLGLAIPVYPGLVVMWLAALGYGVASGFTTAGIIIFVVISLLALFGSVVDNILMAAGARNKGVAWWVIVVGLGAGVIGTLLLPPFGGLIAAPLTILIIQYRQLGDWRKAWEALVGLATGWGLSVFARLAIGFGVMALWWLWVWIDLP